MAVFRWRHFAGEIILWAVRWYCRYGISYRELEEMMGERGVAVGLHARGVEIRGPGRLKRNGLLPDGMQKLQLFGMQKRARDMEMDDL